ncbi:MAG TPA: glycerol kinase GlpK [bacterium]|nr:glycerol kinase GlpK [bacterium]
MPAYVMALDQGTTSSRTIIFDEQAQVVAQAAEPLPISYPRPGWVEQDPLQIWATQRRTLEAALAQAGLRAEQLTAIGITNQRETTLVWDRETGEPLGNAIVWQDRRTAAFCDELKAEGLEADVRLRTGLVIDPYFSATKLRWILDKRPGARDLANKGRLAFGTVDAWLIWQLTGGKVHAVDATNASRTMLYDIFANQWDEALLDRLHIPALVLPEVRDSSGVVAETDPDVVGARVPIAGVAGDQHAALFGQACFEPGMAKNTYGTGCFMLINTGAEPIHSSHGLLTTLAWQMHGRQTYALEGAVFIAGAVVQWLRDGLGLFAASAETQGMAESVADTGGVYLVPAFVGLGAPHWDPYARGAILGLTRDTNRNHLARAALESIAFQSYDVLRCMEEDTGLTLQTLRVDGGAAANDFLCQFQADILGRDVSRPRLVETTALGAAFLAGLATNVWRNPSVIRNLWAEERRFTPHREPAEVQHLLADWVRAVERAKGWARE